MLKTTTSRRGSPFINLRARLNTTNVFAWTLALGASLAFSVAAPVARGAIVGGMDSTTLLVARLVIAVTLLAATTAVTQPAHFKVDGRGFAIITIAGLASGVAMLCFFWSLARLDASMAAMILSTMPLFVLVILAFLGEKFTRRNSARLALGLGGVYLVIGPGGEPDVRGVLLALTAVIFFAGQLVLTQFALKGRDSRTITLYMTMMMAVVVVGYWLMWGEPWVNPGVRGWMAIGTLAVVSTYLARLFMYGAIARLGSGQMSLLLPLETLLTVTWSVVFLRERLTPIQLVGGVLILASALLAIQRLGRAQWRPRWRVWTRS